MLSHSSEISFEPFRIVWSSPFSAQSRVAVSSYNKSMINYLKIFKFTGSTLVNESETEITYPICDLEFSPNGTNDQNDRLISCGDNLKLWQISPEGTQLALDVQTSEKVPLTTLDWSTFQESLVLTGGSDGAATAIDISCGQIVARIIAHDHPVHDISFCGSTPTFVTASFDGSLRFFDLRDLQSSFIYFQTSMPLMRIDVSPFDSNYIASFSKNSPAVTIIDTRHPGIPVYVCEFQDTPVSCIGWSRASQYNILWSNTDRKLLTADLGDSMRPPGQVVYNADGPIECFSVNQDVVGMTLLNRVDIVKYASDENGQAQMADGKGLRELQ